MINSFSYPSGEPPTPIKTPTSATFAPSPFQTPKLESSFYDPRVTWNTTDPWATSPDFLKTPKCLTYKTPTKSPPLSQTQKQPLPGRDLEAQIASHVHHLSPNPNLSFPPVEPARQLSSSPNPSSPSAKRVCHRTSEPTLRLDTNLEQDTRAAMRSAGSMQTPPPTSTSASRRKAQQAQVAKLVKESAAKGKRLSPPNFSKQDNIGTSTSQVETSPNLFPGLQFSPEVFTDFSITGPATAPVYPQHKLFWDPDENTDGMNTDFPTDDAFGFGMGIQKTLDPFVSSFDHTAVSHASNNDFGTSTADVMGLPMSKTTTSAHETSFISTSGRTETMTTFANAVNPSLLFSSPGQSSKQSDLPQFQISKNENLQPYAHQIRDAQLEKEMESSRRPKRRRGPEADSPAVKAALIALRDGKSESSGSEQIIRDDADLPMDNRPRKTRLSSGSPETQIPRRSSPMKQRSKSQTHRHSSTRQPRRKSALTFTIDANGRAKTETKFVDEEGNPVSENQMDVDSTSEESESTPDDDDDDAAAGITMSQAQSFNFPVQKPKQPRLGRFVTDPKTHSQKSSYASTFASSNTTNSLPGRDTSKKRVISEFALPLDTRVQSTTNQFDLTPSSATISDHLNGLEHEMDSDTERARNPNDGKGDAQSELKKVIQKRSQNKPAKQLQRSGSGRRVAPQYQAYPTYGSQVHPYPTGGYGRGQNTYMNTSPTTITDPDFATPSTTRTTDSTRCVCHVTDTDDELMILW